MRVCTQAGKEMFLFLSVSRRVRGSVSLCSECCRIPLSVFGYFSFALVRREHDEDFEGWTLPLVHHTHRKNKLHYEYYFPNYAPLSRIEY